MQIDDTTYGELKKIAALFSGVTPEPVRASIHTPLIGEPVIVRSTQSGVWFGYLTEAIGADVRLSNARKVWRWEGAGATSGLALTGPLRGKIAPPVGLVALTECSEVIQATDAAVKAFSEVTPWTGR